MAVISLQEAMEKAYDDDFWKFRGLAVQSYASLEQSLCSLFSLVSGTERSAAAIIFFKIASADSRNNIITQLVKQKFNSRFSVFWNSMVKHIGQIDKRRNAVVHWNTINWVTSNEKGETEIRLLLKPGQSNVLDGGDEIDRDGLVHFIEDCDFTGRLLNVFVAVNSDASEFDDAPAWLAAFENEKLTYPPAIGSKFDLSRPNPINPSSHFVLG